MSGSWKVQPDGNGWRIFDADNNERGRFATTWMALMHFASALQREDQLRAANAALAAACEGIEAALEEYADLLAGEHLSSSAANLLLHRDAVRAALASHHSRA